MDELAPFMGPRIATMPSQREQVIEQAHERIARIRSDLNAMDYFIFWDASAASENLRQSALCTGSDRFGCVRLMQRAWRKALKHCDT